MDNPVRALVPMAFVKSVAASVEFYGRLGFDVVNTFTPEGQSELSWAYLRSFGAQLMLAKASHPVDPAVQAILFYAYCDDVAALRERVLTEGIQASAITYPFYAPRGEFRVTDPDGYVVQITHT
jgi:catechol 2,3-dioxygenase-like lactoylglutathione lyase family enzyme